MLKRRRNALSFDRRSVARASSVCEPKVAAVENSGPGVATGDANRIAFVPGVDERFLAFRPDGAGEDGLAIRLRTLRRNTDSSHAVRVSAATALLFAEAASIVRVQHRSQDWLGIESESGRFEPVADYGSSATLAHELGHLSFDPPERLENLRVDSYAEGRTDPRGEGAADFVEQRANAFAVAFLAPNDAVRETAPPPLTADSVAKTIRMFGIGKVAAGHRICNSRDLCIARFACGRIASLAFYDVPEPAVGV